MDGDGAWTRDPGPADGLALSLDGKTAAAANYFSGSLGILDLEKRALRATVPLPGGPYDVVIGPGGTGKTRLSLQVAAEQFSEFKDGAWLISWLGIVTPSGPVDVLVSRLRDRIDRPFEKKLLQTVRGVGYVIG